MITYPVKKGDTLWRLARDFGVSVQEIAAANNLKGEQLHQLKIDQILLIPIDAPHDTQLSLEFKGLDHQRFTPKNVRVEQDGITSEYKVSSTGPILLSVSDHSKGMRVWIQDLTDEFIPVFEQSSLPIGEWKVSIDSRETATKGNLQPKQGKPNTTKDEVKAAVTHTAQNRNGITATTQARADNGAPVKALATIYVDDNLRLHPENEIFRTHIITAAKKYGFTPHSLATMIAAEVGYGAWDEKSNIKSPTLAQGLGQFFEPAWIEVRKHPKSLLHADCKNLAEKEFFAKRHEAKYSIDATAALADMNLTRFMKATKFDVSALSSEDQAKLAYVLHHEGVLGTMRLIGKAEPRTSQEAENLLIVQLGGRSKNPKQREQALKRARELIKQYSNDPVKAYNGWLFTFTDAKVNVQNFLVQDKTKFSVKPRGIAEILSSLSSIQLQVTPLPRATPSTKAANGDGGVRPQALPRESTTAKPDTASGAAVRTQTETGPQWGSGGVGPWHNPLAKCEIRTKGLLSKKSARFGLTRVSKAGKPANHQGLDLVAAPGTPVYAVADGIVRLFPQPHAKFDYGHILLLVVHVDDLPEEQAKVAASVNPSQTTIAFAYAHLSEFCVKGGPVEAGTLIGKTGCTGNAKNMTTIDKGAHLHFEVRKNWKLPSRRGIANQLDPELFVKCSNA